MIDQVDVKCVVWDLDHTIWDGILSESDTLTLKPGIEKVLNELDCRGILMSIASRNNYPDAIAKLREFGIDHLFLFPQINWDDKSQSIQSIQRDLNIGIETILFIDDQPFERDQVKSALPQVETVDAIHYLDLLDKKRLQPQHLTDESRTRRLKYMQEITRQQDQQSFIGSDRSFLESLDMEFIITTAEEQDLARAEELTLRTNQLNATGVTYDYEELKYYMDTPDHKLLVCELTDKYGSYGKIGLALVELKEKHHHLKMLLMSCRVLSRSVGSVFLSYIMQDTKQQGKKLLADFRKTDRNEKLYISYKLINFKEISSADEAGFVLMENDLSFIPKVPHYITLKVKQTQEY